MKWTTNFLGGLAIALVYLFGKADAALYALIFFVVCDYITGMIAAWLNGRISSKQGTKGIVKKVGIFVLVALVYQADKVFPAISGWESPLRDATIWALAINELFSNIENLGEWGVEIPKSIAQRLEKLKNKRDS